MTISLLVDLTLSGLLVAVLVYGVILNRRLAGLRADRDQLASVIVGLDKATARAVAGMDGLKLAADANGRSLQGAIERARSITEDLTFLVERGEKAAERLEASTRSDASRGPRMAAAVASPAPREAPAAPVLPARPRRPLTATREPPSDREPSRIEAEPRQDLLKTLEGMR